MNSSTGNEGEAPERYVIKRRLGSGGNGEAYLAIDSTLRREVVLKRVHAGGEDTEAIHEILTEAGKMAAMKHPNVVSVHDIFMSEGSPCIVMEYVPGDNLNERVERHGPLSINETAELARQTLEALVAAHTVGLIHRDLKPPNIMISGLPSGSFQAKLLDFGMAKFIKEEGPSPQTVAIDGTVKGSIQFISPEQLSREPVDQRSDLYSLGCSLYYAVTGRYPFAGDTVTEVIASHLGNKVVPPRIFRKELGVAIEAWLMRLLKRHPIERFPTALVALQALRDATLADGIISATTASIPAGYASGDTAPIASFPHGSYTSSGFGTAATNSAPENPASAGSAHGKRTSIPWVAALCAVILVLAGVVVWSLTKPSANAAPNPSVATEVTPPAPLPTPAPELVAPAPVTPEPVLAAPTAPQPAIIPEPSPEPVIPAVVAPKITYEVVGSNTIGAKLMPAMVKGYLQRIGALDLKEEHPKPEETMISFQLPGNTLREAVAIRAHGSSTSFQALGNETAQLGMSSRPVKADEVERLAGMGDMLSRACEHVVGLDGLAVIVNQSNPISSLTVLQVARIFSGEITDWSELGGRPGPISLYARDDKSGTFDSFSSMVLVSRKLRHDAKRFEDSNALSDDVASDPRGIGFIGLPYVRNSKALALSDEGTLPMLPSPFTVATEDYVLSRRLFLYCPAVPSHPWTLSFIEFALSDAGQEIVELVGFIPQTIEIEQISIRDDMPSKFKEFLASSSSERLSLTFRFRSSEDVLDAKAVRDLDRVVRYLARPENRRKQIYLLGFSDSSGGRSINMQLSEGRAKSIAREFASRGITPEKVIGMGPEMPVASNQSVDGQNKNRRVEVWVR